MLRSEPRQKDKSGNTQVAPISATPVFPDFPVFLVSRISPPPGFDGLNVFRQRGTKNIGYAWLSLCYGVVTRPHGRLSKNVRLTTVKSRERICELGGL